MVNPPPKYASRDQLDRWAREVAEQAPRTPPGWPSRTPRTISPVGVGAGLFILRRLLHRP